VVVPAKDEAENLGAVLPAIPSWVDEIVLVDDHSHDGTAARARELRPDIRVVTNQRRPGKGNALLTGFEAATGDIIVQLDADGSADPREIVAFVGGLLAGADLVKGSRFVHGGRTYDMPWYRRYGNAGLLRLVRILFGGRYTDFCHGYVAFWRDVPTRLRLDDAEGFEIEALMNIRALRARLHVVEVPNCEAARLHGRGHLRTFPDGWRVLKTIVRERREPFSPAGVERTT
jgi:glycosyltransferase involved in cell wall biosynthesis